MTTVFSCTTIPGTIKLGTTYEVLEWVYEITDPDKNKFTKNPRIVCDDGETRVVWKGYFHD